MYNKNEFLIASVETGKLNALVKNIMREMGVKDPNEAIRLINSRDWVVTKAEAKAWKEKDGVIIFSLTSDGTTGAEWIERLKKKGSEVQIETKKILLSEHFKPTRGITTEIAVLKGELFVDGQRSDAAIKGEAGKRKLKTLNMENACLIREKFTDGEVEAMGLDLIIVMHEAIMSDENVYRCLSVDTNNIVYTPQMGPTSWKRSTGFAFATL